MSPEEMSELQRLGVILKYVDNSKRDIINNILSHNMELCIMGEIFRGISYDDWAKTVEEMSMEKFELDLYTVYEEGIEEGEQKGIKIGEQKGAKKELLKIIDKMLEKGLSPEEISKMIDIDVEEVKRTIEKF